MLISLLSLFSVGIPLLLSLGLVGISDESLLLPSSGLVGDSDVLLPLLSSGFVGGSPILLPLFSFGIVGGSLILLLSPLPSGLAGGVPWFCPMLLSDWFCPALLSFCPGPP